MRRDNREGEEGHSDSSTEEEDQSYDLQLLKERRQKMSKAGEGNSTSVLWFQFVKILLTSFVSLSELNLLVSLQRRA